MKKSKLISKVLIAFLLVIVSNSISAQMQSDKKYRFRINIPTNWSKQSHMDGTDKIYDYSSPDQNAGVQLRVFEATPQVTLDVLCQAYESNYLPAGTQKGSLVDYTSVNGIPGKQGLYILNYNNTEVTIATFYTVQNNIGYVLSAIIPTGMVEQKGAELKQITHSFIIDGFEKAVVIKKETEKPKGLSGLLGRSTENKDLSGENISSGNSFESNQGTNEGSSFVYEGQTYRTVKIGKQVWMAENLNVGKMIRSSIYQENNNIVEKYCYDNNESNCDKFGGLYRWKELMQWTSNEGARGICPNGWHIPTDTDWKLLEGYVDSEYKQGDPIWDTKNAYRGKDVGIKLKSTSGWKDEKNGTDALGFSILPAGKMSSQGNSGFLGLNSAYWTSTINPAWGDLAFVRMFVWDIDNPSRSYVDIALRYSVRCIKNE